MLGRYRVLDLTDSHGLIAGSILADLGADVIAIEPPTGSPARHAAPFWRGPQNRDRHGAGASGATDSAVSDRHGAGASVATDSAVSDRHGAGASVATDSAVS